MATLSACRLDSRTSRFSERRLHTVGAGPRCSEVRRRLESSHSGIRAGRSHSLAGQLAGLLHPSGELSFVDLVALVDVKVPHVLLLGLDGGEWTQRRTAKEGHLDVLRDAMEAEEPALALDAVERRVPLHSLGHIGDGTHDERVELSADVLFPARHGRNEGLHGLVAVTLRDLRVAAGKEFDRLGCTLTWLELLQRRGILGHRGPNERLERVRIDLLPFVDVDCPSRV